MFPSLYPVVMGAALIAQPLQVAILHAHPGIDLRSFTPSRLPSHNLSGVIHPDGTAAMGELHGGAFCVQWG